MKTADHWADVLYDLVSIKCKDVWHMPEVRALVAEIQADARRAALEEAARHCEIEAAYSRRSSDHYMVEYSGSTAEKLGNMLRALLDDAGGKAAEPKTIDTLKAALGVGQPPTVEHESWCESQARECNCGAERNR